MRTIDTLQLHSSLEVNVEVMVRRPGGAPAKAAAAVYAIDMDDPERGQRAAKRRQTKRRERRKRFQSDAEIAALRGFSK